MTSPESTAPETTPEVSSERKTHIEVCVRIRPLEVATESSNSFLVQRVANGESQSVTTTHTRRGAVRNPRSSGGSRLRNLFKRSHSPDPNDQHDASGNNSNIVAWVTVGDTTVRQSPQTNLIQGRTHQYTLDQVYGPAATTNHVFGNSVQELVHAAVDGYHTSVLAYGQTSTGKTHTMTGTTKEPGLIPMAVQECFSYIEKQVEPKEYLIRVVRVMCLDVASFSRSCCN